MTVGSGAEAGGGQGWVVWFTGLPGAGKSTLAGSVLQALRERGEDVVYLSMDERRRAYVPEPRYTGEEREAAYRSLAEEAARTAGEGRNVIVDGTAPRLAMRRYARGLVPRFLEVMVRCPLETAIDRERHRPEGRVMAGLYDMAIRRRDTGERFEGLGEVVGVDLPFEEDPEAECIVDSNRLTVEEGRDLVLERLSRWGVSDPGRSSDPFSRRKEEKI